MFPMSSGPSVVDIHKSKAPQLYAAAVTTYVLAMLTVALRFWARRLMRSSILVDDWTVTVALFVTTGYLVNVIVSIHQGFGEHYESFIDDCAITFGKNLYTEQLLYFVVIGLAKISILALYWRLFSNSKPVRISCYSLGAIVTCWEITALLVTVFQCRPVSGYWNKEIHSKCIDEKHFFLGYSIPNILTDFALLLVPVSSIWRLQMRTSHKLGVVGMFMLGSLVTVISVVRLIILLKLNHESPDLDYNYVSLSSWSIAESNMAIVAACLPSLRPIFTRKPRNEPQPSAERPNAPALRESWLSSHHSSVMEPHKQSTSRSGSQHDLIRSPEETFASPGKSGLYGAAIWSTRDPGLCDLGDVEMQKGSRLAKTERQSRIRVDVTISTTEE